MDETLQRALREAERAGVKLLPPMPTELFEAILDFALNGTIAFTGEEPRLLRLRLQAAKWSLAPSVSG